MSSMPELPSADAWAVDAAAWPLAFAQVREDPRLDMELARHLPAGERIVMIASGGDTAASLGRLPLQIHLVDVNPTQLALGRLKWRLASDVPSEHAAALLGHLPMNLFERAHGLGELKEELGLEDDIFGPAERVAAIGPDQCGRYEQIFARLRTQLLPWQASLAEMLACPLPLPGFGESGLARALDAAFAEVMSLQNLVRLFGAEATRNPQRPFAEHFASRTREIICRVAPCTNPFLQQILCGGFHPGFRYDWLQAPHAMNAQAEWHHGKMRDLLEAMPAESAGLVHLSNILDWLSPEDGQATLLAARRVLKPRGKVIIRQLNSSLDIPALDTGLDWNAALGQAMERRDRSYFYPLIHVGSRP
ncbi:DUF3419 family protein [Haloferula sp. BvORR071]|uniref:DUF3419 family protein n=1 Tax=Haloferula sp. BvORR071 TaxID=1396141 RepID=UPI000697AC1F|nr:DUF3419 family protein [Haloferula sp. BvORR071]